MWGKPNVSPPGCATSRLRPTNQLHFLPCANVIHRMPPELSSVDKANKNGCHGNVKTSLEGSKNYFQPQFYQP